MSREPGNVTPEPGGLLVHGFKGEVRAALKALKLGNQIMARFQSFRGVTQMFWVPTKDFWGGLGRGCVGELSFLDVGDLALCRTWVSPNGHTILW